MRKNYETIDYILVTSMMIVMVIILVQLIRILIFDMVKEEKQTKTLEEFLQQETIVHSSEKKLSDFVVVKEGMLSEQIKEENMKQELLREEERRKQEELRKQAELKRQEELKEQEKRAKQKAEFRQKVKEVFIKILLVMKWICISIFASVGIIAGIFLVPFLKFSKKVQILRSEYNYFRFKRKDFVETLTKLSHKEDCEKILYEIDTKTKKYFDQIRELKNISFWRYIFANKIELRKNIEEILQFTDEKCIQIIELTNKNKLQIG